MSSDSSALSFFDKKTLAETRKYSRTCGNKIAEDKANFANKSGIGLWWDAKGFFNSSDAGDVTAQMEKFRKMYQEIDTIVAQVENGDAKSYDRLMEIYKKIDEMEAEASREVDENQSKMVCQTMREFLGKKLKLDHSLKQVECVVLKQNMARIERNFGIAQERICQMSRNMDQLVEENRVARQESDERLTRLLETAEARYEVRMEEMRKQNDKLRSEADRRSEAIRRESDERLRQAVQEANQRSEDRIREMAEQNQARSEDRIREMAEQNQAFLQRMVTMLERINL